MSDQTSVLADLLLTDNQAAKEAAANNLFNAMSLAALYAMNPETTTGLTWGYIGGRYLSTSISNGTVSLTASNDNYVVAAASNGAVTVSTATTNWNNTTDYIRLYKVVTNGSGPTGYEDHRPFLRPTSSSAVKVIQIAASDESTALTSGTAKVTFRMPYAMTLTAVRASLTTAQATNGAGGIFTVDINESGTTILSTKLTIDNTETTSTTAATPAVISDASLADDAEITIDIDQIGDGTAKGLKITLIGT